MIRGLLIATIALAGAAGAGPLKLGFPVDCDLGSTCFIQNYVDRDPGTGVADFACGDLSYDDHGGTDIALIDLEQMERGVAVHPVAPGVVRATRDEMPDISSKAANAPDITNRSCGNAVIIDHGGGWQTRYCHLKLGSVTVRTGDRVNLTTQIGQIGLSGRTEFPHLHLTLLQNGERVDPFQPDTATCGDTSASMWVEDIDYSAGGLLNAGFTDALPEFEEIKAGTADKEELSVDSEAVVLWAHAFGTQPDDILKFSIAGPDGEFLQRTVTLNRTQARAFRAVGRKNASGWPPGSYEGTVQMIRDGKPLGTRTVTAQIK